MLTTRRMFFPTVKPWCYALTAILSAAIAFVALHLWQADLRVPFNYAPGGQDSFINMMWVKGTLQNGWYLHNSFLGAPGELNQLDFPMFDSLHFAIIRAIGLIQHSWGAVLNEYYLLTFPLIAIAALYAGKFAGLSTPAAIVVSQLYAFLPFHLIRGEMHLTLGAYYMVPLTLPAILTIARGEALSRGWWVAAPAFALIGLSNIYHAAFALFFVMVAAIIGIARRGRAARTACANGALLFLLTAATLGLQFIPSALHTRTVGPNPLAVNRSPADADTFGLKLAQLILPVPGHRLPNLAFLRSVYAADFPDINENESAALGFIGAAGFLMLLFRAALGLARITRPTADPNSTDLLDTLAMLTIAGLLLATVGGFGSVFNFLIVPIIRAYNRISIFLALFALIGIAAALDRTLREKWRWPVFVLVLLFGLFDQIPATAVPNFAQNQAGFQSDARFIASIESTLPAGSMIFQLPIVDFPESPPVHDLSDYELFRAYLHSNSLRWSYGAMKGREVAQWQHRIAKLPTTLMVDQIVARGFAGIYLDRRAYADDSVESQLKSILGTPQVSDDGRMVLFALPTTK
ncbi:MAG: hypothetical protein JO353_00815 [Phycisphaerae bacterium]|nr:hypothetical protein [Phycisphaerae bacterium]